MTAHKLPFHSANCNRLSIDQLPPNSPAGLRQSSLRMQKARDVSLLDEILPFLYTAGI
jgi:hypothetical protein